MATRVEQFALKLSYLKACLSRLENNRAVSPSDYTTIIGGMKYFKQVILNVQSEKNNDEFLWPPVNKARSYGNDNDTNWDEYISSYPSLDYSGLHELTLLIVQCIPFTSESRDVCACLLEMLCHTLPFMEESFRIELPLQVASLLPDGDFDFHGLIIDNLSDSIIPMCFVHVRDSEDDTCLSSIVPAIITIMFEFVTDAPLHMKLIETLMIFKTELWKDLLMVIAYGAEPVKICAVKYLFHYWPHLYTDGTANHAIPATSLSAMISCENKSCKSKNDIVATAALFDPVLSAHYGWKNAPLYLCDACKNTAWKKSHARCFFEIFLRKEKISYYCENKTCFSQDKIATVSLCGNDLSYSTNDRQNERLLDKQRSRYCEECFNNVAQCFEKNQLLIQSSPGILWDLQCAEDKTVMVDAIVNLLDDTCSGYFASGSSENSCDDGRTSNFYLSMMDGSYSSLTSGTADPVSFHYLCKTCCENLWNTNGGPQCQFGIWVLTALCPARKNIPGEEGRLRSLLSSTIQWCANATYLPSDEFGGKLENIKLKLMKGWMTDVSNMHFKTFTSHLLPKKKRQEVSEQWDAICPEWQYYCNGFKLILCLAMYSIVKKDMWNKIMPPWIELLNKEYENIKDSLPLKEVLTKLFDVDLSPLPFDPKYIFEFVTKLFQNPHAKSKMKGLSWLQTLTEMEIIFPISSLLQMFFETSDLASPSDDTLKPKFMFPPTLPRQNSLEFEALLECSTAMLNIIHEQMVLQEIHVNSMILPEWTKVLFNLLTENLTWICKQKVLNAEDEKASKNTFRKEACGLKKSNASDDEKAAKAQQDLETPPVDRNPLHQDQLNDEKFYQEELLIVWFRKTYSILKLALPDKIESKPRHSGLSFESQRSHVNFHMDAATGLARKFIEALSKQNDPIRQYVTLQSLHRLCESCDIFEHVLSSESREKDENNFCVQFPILWSTLSLGCYDMFKCATSILLRSLMVAEIADSFISRISQLLASLSWIVRYDAIDRLGLLMDSIKPHHTQKRSAFTRVISTCLYMLLSMLDDDQLEVEIKCTHIMESMSCSALKHACSCLELEFTSDPQNRSFLLLRMQIISRIRPDVNLFSVFYSACMGYVVKRGRYGQDQDGIVGLQQKWTSDLAMAPETVQLLIHVISKYITEYSANQTNTSSDTKCFQSMLRNFFIHFGYNDQIGYFTLKPTDVRKSVGLSSFMLNLPKILDSNANLGPKFLPTAITLLEYTTFPELYSMNSQQISHQLTLHLLPEPLQQAWISSLLLILYKHSVPDAQQMQLMQLVIVCLNTLESEIHLCANEQTLMRLHGGDNDDSNSDSHYVLNSIAWLPPAMSPRGYTRSKSTRSIGRQILSPDRVESHSRSFHSKTGKSTTLFGKEAKLDSQVSASTNALSGMLKIENRSSSVDSLHFAKTSKKNKRIPSLRSSTVSGPEKVGVENDSKEESSDCEEYSAQKKLSISISVGSQSPYRRRTHSEITRDWSKMMQIPLQQEVAVLRCHKCNEKVLGFSEKVLSGSIINICYFVKFNVEMAAPLLPRILTQLVYISNLLGDGVKERQWGSVPLKVSTVSSSNHVYSTVSKVARQALRCILLQLTSNLLLTKIFLLPLEDPAFLHGLCICLNDYQSLTSLMAVKHVIEGLPGDLKTLSDAEFNSLLDNLSIYMSCLTHDSSSSQQWQQLINSFNSFCTRMLNVLSVREQCNADGLFSIVIVLLKAHAPISVKQSLLETFSKLLVAVLQKCCFTVKSLYSLCCASCKVFTRTKDKLFLIRYVVSEILSCLKLKNKFLHGNVVMMLQFMLIDIGTCLNPCAYQSLDAKNFTLIKMNVLPCYVTECIRSYLPDCLEIILDVDFLNNLKEHILSNQNELLHGAACADVKVSIAQIVCMELSQTTHQDKTLQSLLPWIYEMPSSVQQGPKDYVDCVSHIRQLSWLLLGSLTHIGLFYSDISPTWQPLPVDLSPHLASIVQVILTGFPGQYRDSLTSLSSLFYVFVFCQLWTLYCDELSYLLSSSNAAIQGGSVLGWDQNPPSTLVMEFWSRVTSSILLLLQHNNSTSDLVHHHISAIMSCLQQYNSAVVFKLYSLWKVMLETRVEDSDIAQSLGCHDTCLEARLDKIHLFYASACVDHQTGDEAEHFREFRAACASSSNEPNRSANKLLRIVDQIKERLAQAEITGHAAENLYIV
ncbi:protein unc-79 homolog isoform X2 [Styela clava]